MLERIIDNTQLEGPRSATVKLRPRRDGLPVDDTGSADLLQRIEQECQVWGGANTPLVPVAQSGTIDEAYARILPGSAIDHLTGLDAFGLYHLPGAKVTRSVSGISRGRQLAVALLEYHSQSQYRPLEIVQLANDDPWRGIYAACLGLLPAEPDRHLLEYNYLKPELTFEDFVQVQRPSVEGSLDDLLGRLGSDTAMTPRGLSMLHLAYGTLGSTAIRDERQPLPAPHYARFDAGPNILVLCSPDSVEDLALLWNLRAAHGDQFVAPIGLPVAAVSDATVQRIARHRRLSHNGISRRQLYVTSASLSVAEIECLLPALGQEVAIASLEQMLTLGPAAGWWREEVLVWHDGESSVVPFADQRYREVFSQPGQADNTDMVVDVAVPTFPFPDGDDIRADGTNWTFAAGAASRHVGRRGSEAVSVTWPNRLLSAQVVAERRDLSLAESEAGRAAMVALSGFPHGWELINLAHAPLLDLLAEMAARQGMSWARDRVRSAGRELAAADVVAPTADDLPEKAFQDFKRTLGNSDKATKYWLFWAERRGLVVKGFPIECPNCRSKQWTPVAAFAPPITCRGCAVRIEAPFGDRPLINFKYRLSERLRRVYEHDAIGHLLAVRYFQSLFGGGESRLVGIHPGLDVYKVGDNKRLGEADNLLLFRNADLVPIEVKRSFSGVVPAEVAKLDLLAATLRSPWSALAVCQYGRDAPASFTALENRGPAAEPFRLILSYDRLLDRHPVWALGSDPFAWKPLSDDAVKKRETEFVQWLASAGDEEDVSWFDYSMLRRPSVPEKGSSKE
jgi:hypothetical protein